MQPQRKTPIWIWLVLLAGAVASPAHGQGTPTPESSPSTQLSAALMAACRQNDTQFAQYLTADNAAAFRQFPPARRTALMERFVLLERSGRPLLSSDPQGRIVLRCETPGITTEMRFGATRVRDNLAFIAVEVRLPGEAPGTGASAARRIQFGLVREAGNWRLLSVGLLLLDLPALAKQWEDSELDAGENAAIAVLRKLADAVNTYRRAFGKLPETLAQLGPAPKEGISPEAAGLVDAELAAGSKAGYLFRYRVMNSAEAGEPGKDAGGFELAAVPAEYGKSGRRSFLLDAGGTLHGADKGGALATGTDPRIEPR